MRQVPPPPPRPTPATGDATSILKVPFGLREGRLFSPTQVQAGLKCGCTCPACGAPLVAKAAESQFRLPHFSHLGHSDCRAGYETALHLKAKHLIRDHACLALPAWDGEPDMPNPPTLADDEGRVWTGDPVDFPLRRVVLTSVQLEQPIGDYTPDVMAVDEEGRELLIEVRVTHAVEALKQRRLRADDRRCFEIDLSNLARGALLDEDALRETVLFQPGNRSWVACSSATDAWRESRRKLKEHIAEVNRQIAEAREERTRLEAERAAAVALQRQAQADQEDRRRRFQAQQRAPHLARLEMLPELVSPERVEKLLAQYEARDGRQARALLSQIADPEVRRAVAYDGSNAWIYTALPSLWQAATYEHFVLKRALGEQFNGRDVARWVMREFGRDEDLYALFRAQYEFRTRVRNAGKEKNRISFWAFTELENRQIPNFYKPINDFIDRLVYVRTLERVDSPIGELRLPSP